MLEDKELRALFSLIMNNSVSSTFTDELKNLIANAKKNTKWRHQYMIWENNLADERRMAREEGLAEGRAAGRIEGESKKALEDAKNFLKLGVVTPVQIAQCTGLPLEQVEQLEKELKAELIKQ